MKMKNIVIYSPDFSLCYSLLMYLQTQYKVVATTDMDGVAQLVDLRQPGHGAGMQLAQGVVVHHRDLVSGLGETWGAQR